MSEISEFYDEFSSRQVTIGINNRHISILFHLEKAGLKENANILEVGCGVGTVSELILRALSSEGSLHAVDISPQSIKIAKQLKKKYQNSTFEVKDFTQETINKRFDIIILPDVIEHIPVKLYPIFFKNLYGMLEEDGFIFIHIPHPNHLEWLVKIGSKELQIIDQPIYTDQFLSVVYPIGFYLHYLKSYSVYSLDDDYQVLILKKKKQSNRYQQAGSPFQLPFYIRIKKKVQYLIRGFK